MQTRNFPSAGKKKRKSLGLKEKRDKDQIKITKKKNQDKFRTADSTLRFLLSSKGRITQLIITRIEFPPATGSRNRRGISSRQRGMGRGGERKLVPGERNARSRTQTSELTTIARAVFLPPPSALFSSPLHRPALSPLPAPPCRAALFSQ